MDKNRKVTDFVVADGTEEKLIRKGSAKGDQLKWLVGDYWYKADRNGYEGLAEVVVSKLLSKSNLKPENYIDYDLATIKYKNKTYQGCKSKNFLLHGESLITLESLYRQFSGQSLTAVLAEINNLSKEMTFMINFVNNLDLDFDFTQYLSNMLMIDMLFLNEDRHLHNIALIQKTNGQYRAAPIFDNGASLLSDIENDYPLSNATGKLMKKVRPKTFDHSFSEIENELLKRQIISIEFSFNEADVKDILENCTSYSDEIENRIIYILNMQREKYDYYFK